ncbi:MAG: hypothetical protein J6S40_08080 [Thermoguttaceae bacterium]|nr:hypothetical protein [Thermoguttaceae bacterium]
MMMTYWLPCLKMTIAWTILTFRPAIERLKEKIKNRISPKRSSAAS